MRLLRVPGVFYPISDSWMLAGQLRQENLRGAAVLDLCTGSGMLAVLASRLGASEAVAVDVSRRALISARLNAALNGVRVQPRRGDLFGAVSGRRFDVIVSNPPHVPSPAKQLPDRGLARAWEAGPDGRVFLNRICAEAPAHLRPGGALLLVHSAICDAAQTLERLAAAGLEPDLVFRHVGRLGPLMSERSGWLRSVGLLEGEQDEVVVIRAQAPAATPAEV
jgi:release factor glutamine methyltransferase